MSIPPSSLKPDWRQMIRSSSEELDLRQLGFFAHLSPTRRLEIMFELCDLACQLVMAGELDRNPDLTETELAQRVRERFELARELDQTMSIPITTDSASIDKSTAAN